MKKPPSGKPGAVQFIFSMVRRGVKPEINAIATLIILFSIIVAALGLWLRSRRSD